MRITSYLKALRWEFLQNLPMIVGFLIAARLRLENLALALIVLVIGIGLGSVLMHYTEPFLHKAKFPATWKGDLLNLALFVGFGLPFLFYFTTENRWINWKMDLTAGILVGVLLSAGQAVGWKGEKSRIVVHGVAMSLSFPLIMLGLRYALTLGSWAWMVLTGILVSLLASMLITWIDYGEMYKA